MNGSKATNRRELSLADAYGEATLTIERLEARLAQAERHICNLIELYECHYPEGCECDDSVGMTCPACSARRFVPGASDRDGVATSGETVSHD